MIHVYFKHCPPSSPIQPASVRTVAHALPTAALVCVLLDTPGSTVKMSYVGQDGVCDVQYT